MECSIIGSTTDIKRRIGQHEIGNSKATSGLRPLRLEFYQEFDSIGSARAIERRLKKLKRRDYIEKIIKDRQIKMGLRRSAFPSDKKSENVGSRSPD